MVPDLPPNVSQTLIASGTSICPVYNPGANCTQFAGADWWVIAHGGSGGSHYDSTGNLFIAVPTGSPLGGNDNTIEKLVQLAPDGTITHFGNYPIIQQTCTVTSSSSILVNNLSWLSLDFYVNPASNSLYLVTQNAVEMYTWNPSTTSGKCARQNAVFTPSSGYTQVNLTTYALIQLTGSGI